MKQTIILLDTNFILSCIKNKIDFFEEIKFMGFQIIISQQVINEIKKISSSKQKFHNKEIANLTLTLLDKNQFKKINLGKGHVDKSIMKFAKENPEAIVATLDRELKNKLRNKKLVIRGKKKLEIQ